MSSKRPLIALLTDFGTHDPYVGVMKGVMKSICPEAEFIDITHDIPPQDIRAGAFALMSAYSYFPKGTVFLVVIDPGVGTKRRAVIVQTADHTFVAPDNGVLSYTTSTDMTNQTRAAWEITIPPAHPHALSYTFHGRDVFAPHAAYAAGEITPPANSRKTIAANTLQRLPAPSLDLTEYHITGEVLYIDGFGNLITSIGRLRWQATDHLAFDPVFEASPPQADVSSKSEVQVQGVSVGRIRHTYGEVEVGELVALVGSSGHLEIALNGGSAAATLAAQTGDTVTIQRNKGC